MSTVNTSVKTKPTFTWLINTVFSSRLFPFVMAAIILACYYTGLDLVAIYIAAICGILIFVFCEDLTPFITVLLFINVLVSYKHSPSFTAAESNYFFRPEILWQVVALIALIVAAGVYRLFKTCCLSRFKPTHILYGLIALAVTFLLNGVLTPDYTPMNLVYGLVQVVIYLGLYAVLKDNIKLNEQTFEKLALSFFALSLVLVTELTVLYLTNDGIYANGTVDRNQVAFGWGVYNTMGMLLLLCLPAVFYLAAKYRLGNIFTAYSFIIVAAIFLSTSRQAMLGVVIVYPLCLAYMFVKAKYRLVHLFYIVAAAAAVIAFTVIYRDEVYSAFKQIFDNVIVGNGMLYGGGRTWIYEVGLTNFENYPLFGVGFYGKGLEGMMNNASGIDAIPYFYHNTLIQMAATCGIFGLLAYLIHRFQTILNYANHITVERSFVAVSIFALLFVSLLDVHMFDILPTLLYSSLLAVLVASGKKKEQPKPVPNENKNFIILIEK